jgi:hypothetical protein
MNDICLDEKGQPWIVAGNAVLHYDGERWLE